MRSIPLVATCLMLVLMLCMVPDSSFTAAAVVLALAATMASVGVLAARNGLIHVHTATGHGPDDETTRRRGSFGRQSRPGVPGRPQPRAPGALVGTR